MLERALWMLQVFEDIEHQDQIKRSIRLIGCVEGTMVNPASPLSVWAECVLVTLDPKRFAVGLKRLKQKSITATNVEDAVLLVFFITERFNLLQDCFFARSPPPVLLIEDSIMLRVRLFHRTTLQIPKLTICRQALLTGPEFQTLPGFFRSSSLPDDRKTRAIFAFLTTHPMCPW